MTRKSKSKKRKRQPSKTAAAATLEHDGCDHDHPEQKETLDKSRRPPPSKREPETQNNFPIALPLGRKFLTPQDDGFANYVRDHYKGFVHLPVDHHHQKQLNFHQFSKRALERLRDANYYQYDVVMAGGKHSSRTFVKRTLVGNPGITYKYLGLRLFAHAWSGPGVSPHMQAIGEMNQKMIQMTKQFPDHGNCDYNLTLINYMEPTSHASVGFKEEANYGMGKVSVSWHADSSLENGSAIGVYHCLPTQRAAKWDWRIALRPAPDESSSMNSVIPVVVNTKDGDAYFLLGNFNETYQHCVLAGSQASRISSTHRVAVTAEDTYDYILKRVKIARKRFRLQMEQAKASSVASLDAKVVRYCQQVLTEVEMEWIAQYWLQGAQHDKMHVWWQRPMRTLEAYWKALEELSCELYQLCVNHISSRAIPVGVLKVLINEFTMRQSLREAWDERRADKIYQRRINAEYRPVARPLFDDATATGNDEKSEARLPKDLKTAIQDLTVVLERRKHSIKAVTQSPKNEEASLQAADKKRAPGSSSIEEKTKMNRKKKTKQRLVEQ